MNKFTWPEKSILLFMVLLFPSIVLAESGYAIGLDSVTINYVNWIIYILFAVAMVVLVVGITMRSVSQKDERKRIRGLTLIKIGIFGLVLLPIVWLVTNFYTSAP